MINCLIVMLFLACIIIYIICTKKESFSSIITRPLDLNKYPENRKNTSLNELNLCNNNVGKFYDTRTISTYDKYYNMLESLIDLISSNNEVSNSKLTRTYDCDISDYEVKHLLNNKIGEVIKFNPTFQNNGSFKHENITVTDVNLEYFEDEIGKNYIKATFTIYDLTRSTGTEAHALISVEPKLDVQIAKLVYPNVNVPTTGPMSFDFSGSLDKTKNEGYNTVSSIKTVSGGVSKEMEEILEKYY